MDHWSRQGAKAICLYALLYCVTAQFPQQPFPNVPPQQPSPQFPNQNVITPFPNPNFINPSSTIVPSQQCPVQSQHSIRQCAQELKALGVFTQNQGEIDALTWEQIRRRSRQYFTQICEAYRRFEQCTQPHKLYCWYSEPIKGEFAVAAEALTYVCGEGYYGMLSNWDCFLQASTRGDVINCESRIMAEARALQDASSISGGRYTLTDDSSCRVLQDYMGCIKQPIFNQCGAEAWRLVREAVQRPTRVYLPYCTLSGSAKIPSAMVIILSFILVAIFNAKS